MNNQQIINQRWKKAESLYRSKLPEIRALYNEIGDEAIDEINSLGITFENLNKIVPENTRRQVKRKIEAWKKEGIVKGYFAFMIASLTRYTYAKVFEILLYGHYYSKAQQINSISNEIFRETVQNCYDQANKDLKQETKKLKWAVILPMLMISDYNMSYESYLTALSQTSAQETYRRIIELLKMKAKITLNDLKQLLLKQVNRILNVNKDKYSGAIVDVSRQAGNKGYILPAQEKDQLIRFVAEKDERTTEMCRSLDGQIFHTKAWNRFTRYSDFYKGLHTFSWFGLEQGLNLPPINDHFHWCRSTVTYIIETMNETERMQEIKKMYGFKKAVGVTSYLEKDGIKYYLDHDKIKFNPSDDEIYFAYWFKNNTDHEVMMNPRSEKIDGLRASDYTFDGSSLYDLKGIEGSGTRTIINRIKDSKGQSDNFIINLTEKTKLDVNEAIRQIQKVKDEEDWIKNVYLFDKYEYIGKY